MKGQLSDGYSHSSTTVTEREKGPGPPSQNVWPIGHLLILGIGIEIAYNGGLCGGISLKRDYVICIWTDSPHWPHLQASSSPTLRIWIYSTDQPTTQEYVRHHSREVKALDLQSRGPGFKSSTLPMDGLLFGGHPCFENTYSQLVSLPPVGIFNKFLFNS